MAASGTPPLQDQQGPEVYADEHDSPLFKSDDFRLWCMKVIPCTKRFVHDWTICPFAHAGEKAVRRDPRLHNYTGIACPDMKKTGSCIRGDKCPYAHNVFEYWLHPTRYRTQLCNDGPMCRRGICFFAHSLEELRVPACKPYVSPEALARASLEAIQQNPHPLGQQLPNPVAAAQQQAALAAMNRPSGGGGGMGGGGGGGAARGESAASGLAASAAPFVPGGSLRASGEPSRYSAPSNSSLLGADDYGSSIGSDFGTSLPLPPPQQQRWMQQAHYQPQAAQRWSQQGMGLPPQHYGSSMPSAGPRLSNNSATGMASLATGSAPVHSGMTMAAASMQQRHSRLPQRPPPQGFSTAPFAATVPAAGRPPSPGSLTAGSPPQHSLLHAGGGSGVFVAGGADASAGSVPNVHSVRSSRDSEEEADNASAHSGASSGGRPAPGSGKASPDHDLAQSLASLKIAMTQQQLAAAAGSNHEVVITTLHQILKDAMAQQAGSSPPAAAAGSISLASINAGVGAGIGASACMPGKPDLAGAGYAQAAAAARMAAGGSSSGRDAPWGASARGQYGASPDAVSHSFIGSAPTVPSSLADSAPQFDLSSPPMSDPTATLAPPYLAPGGASKAAPAPTSPDAVACYQAALLAAAGGYNGSLPVGMQPPSSGVGPLARSLSPRTSDESACPAGASGDEGVLATVGALEGI